MVKSVEWNQKALKKHSILLRFLIRAKTLTNGLISPLY